MAALFIGVTLAFPNGLAGVYESYVKPWLARKPTPEPVPAAPPSAPPSAALPEQEGTARSGVPKSATTPAAKPAPDGVGGAVA
jgi:urea transport system permease protein